MQNSQSNKKEKSSSSSPQLTAKEQEQQRRAVEDAMRTSAARSSLGTSLSLTTHDLLDVPLLHHEISRLSSTLSERDQLLSQFRNELSTQVSKNQSLNREIDSLRRQLTKATENAVDQLREFRQDQNKKRTSPTGRRASSLERGNAGEEYSAAAGENSPVAQLKQKERELHLQKFEMEKLEEQLKEKDQDLQRMQARQKKEAETITELKSKSTNLEAELTLSQAQIEHDKKGYDDLQKSFNAYREEVKKDTMNLMKTIKELEKQKQSALKQKIDKQEEAGIAAARKPGAKKAKHQQEQEQEQGEGEGGKKQQGENNNDNEIDHDDDDDDEIETTEEEAEEKLKAQVASLRLVTREIFTQTLSTGDIVSASTPSAALAAVMGGGGGEAVTAATRSINFSEGENNNRSSESTTATPSRPSGENRNDDSTRLPSPERMDQVSGKLGDLEHHIETVEHQLRQQLDMHLAQRNSHRYSVTMKQRQEEKEKERASPLALRRKLEKEKKASGTQSEDEIIEEKIKRMRESISLSNPNYRPISAASLDFLSSASSPTSSSSPYEKFLESQKRKASRNMELAKNAAVEDSHRQWGEFVEMRHAIAKEMMEKHEAEERLELFLGAFDGFKFVDYQHRRKLQEEADALDTFNKELIGEVEMLESQKGQIRDALEEEQKRSLVLVRTVEQKQVEVQQVQAELEAERVKSSMVRLLESHLKLAQLGIVELEDRIDLILNAGEARTVTQKLVADDASSIHKLGYSVEVSQTAASAGKHPPIVVPPARKELENLHRELELSREQLEKANFVAKQYERKAVKTDRLVTFELVSCLLQRFLNLCSNREQLSAMAQERKSNIFAASAKVITGDYIVLVPNKKSNTAANTNNSATSSNNNSSSNSNTKSNSSSTSSSDPVSAARQLVLQKQQQLFDEAEEVEKKNNNNSNKKRSNITTPAHLPPYEIGGSEQKKQQQQQQASSIKKKSPDSKKSRSSSSSSSSSSTQQQQQTQKQTSQQRKITPPPLVAPSPPRDVNPHAPWIFQSAQQKQDVLAHQEKQKIYVQEEERRSSHQYQRQQNRLSDYLQTAPSPVSATSASSQPQIQLVAPTPQDEALMMLARSSSTHSSSADSSTTASSNPFQNNELERLKEENKEKQFSEADRADLLALIAKCAVHWGVLERLSEVFADAQWRLALGTIGNAGASMIDAALNDLDETVLQFENTVSSRKSSPQK